MPEMDDVQVAVEVEMQGCEMWHCANAFPVGEGHDVHGYVVCESCYGDRTEPCGRCGEAEFTDDMYTVGYEQWCCNCADYHTFWCDECYERYPDSDRDDHYHGNDDALLAYDDTPLLRFRGEDPHGYFLGLELEMEDTTGRCVGDAVSTVHGCIPDHFYGKGDGSLHDGWEMVSHPMTLSYWHSMEDRFAEMTKCLRQMGMRSWNTETAGIHVHVSADAFTDSERHLWLFQQLFYKNADSIASFAGRESGQWARLRIGKGDVGFYTKARKKGEGYNLNRYMAVNLTNHSTIEIRVFRGSLNPNRVYANLELVHAAVEYTRNLTYTQVAAGALDFPVFAYWLRQQPQYKHAAQHVTALGLTAARND